MGTDSERSSWGHARTPPQHTRPEQETHLGHVPANRASLVSAASAWSRRSPARSLIRLLRVTAAFSVSPNKSSSLLRASRSTFLRWKTMVIGAVLGPGNPPDPSQMLTTHLQMSSRVQSPKTMSQRSPFSDLDTKLTQERLTQGNYLFLEERGIGYREQNRTSVK